MRMNSSFAVNWPNWTGQPAIILGTGPSAKQALLRQGNYKLIAINDSWELAPWADVLYACDRDWWIRNNGVPRYNGLKVTASPSASKAYGLKQVNLVARARVYLEPPGRIGCGIDGGGGHSGFQALNLAAQFGSRLVGLVGFDMTTNAGIHWHSRGLDRGYTERVKRWRVAMDGAAEKISKLGIEVINLTPTSALKNYRKMAVEDFISWSD